MRFVVALAGAALLIYATFSNADPSLITFATGLLVAPSLVPPEPAAVQPMIDFRQARLDGLDD